MGSFTTGTKLYKPALGEVGYDDEMGTNFDRLSEFGVNVKSYGAVGDGVTDDISALETAAAAAAPGLLVLPPGTYMVSRTWEIDASNIHVIGAGGGATIIKATAGFVSSAGLVAPVVEFSADSSNRADVSIAHLTIDGNRANRAAATEFAPGLQLRTTGANTFKGALIHDLHIKNTSGDNITLRSTGAGGANLIAQVVISGCLLEDPNVSAGGYNARQGIAIIGANDVDITGNVFHTQPSQAIDFEPNPSAGTSSRLTIAGNSIVDSTDYGIGIITASGSALSGVTIAGNSITATTGGVHLNANGANITLAAIEGNSISALTPIVTSTGGGGTISYSTPLRSPAITGPVTIAQGSLTDPQDGLALTATWSDVADTFRAIFLNVTDTNSANGSKLIDLRVGNIAKFSADKDGQLYAAGKLELDGALDHDGTSVGFFGTAPATQRPANADTSGATLAALETEVNELKQLLRDYGLLAP